MNKYCCLATAFSKALDYPLEQIFNITGYTGEEIIWPNHPEPNNRRGHHIQEMIDIALTLGYTVTEIQAAPVFSSLGSFHSIADKEERLSHYLAHYDGVVIGVNERGNRHAVYHTKGSEILNLKVVTFYIIQKDANDNRIFAK